VKILGISAFYHDSAAALVEDGRIIAAAQEERFSRKKHDNGFPVGAVKYCLARGGAGPEGPDAVVFYEKPLDKFDRLLKTFFSVAPRGLGQFVAAMPVWLRERLWAGMEIERGLNECGVGRPREVLFTRHHEAHAASAFFPSPFGNAAVLTIDGVGEWSTATIARGAGAGLDVLEEMRFPHSLGLLYSAFTAFCGFRVNDGEYKLMGLAPYGKPRFSADILDKLVDLKEDGSFRLDMRYFGYLTGQNMTTAKFDRLFGGPARAEDAPITAREADMARSIQEVTGEIVLRMARHTHELVGGENLCLAGGVALNCVANGRLLREGPFKNIWIQPASGDAGGALGAALAGWHLAHEGARVDCGGGDGMCGALLGPEYPDAEIIEALKARGVPARKLGGEEWAPEVAKLVASGRVVALFQGRMEFGPRALGNRSIIADARVPGMRSRLNLEVKKRESFRPFAPSCLAEKTWDYFNFRGESPYMLLTVNVNDGLLRMPPGGIPGSVAEASRIEVSTLPAITHVDGSARLQTVGPDGNPRFRALLEEFFRQTGCGMVLNTSFNRKDEPIVNTPGEALDCFLSAGIDDLALGDYLISRESVRKL
jgi:carbamoyltransferase